MTTEYRIEIKDEYGVWQENLVSDGQDNKFATESDADICIENLRNLGDGWENSTYRVVEIDE